MHIELNGIAQVISAIGGTAFLVLLGLTKFLPVWRDGGKRKN